MTVSQGVAMNPMYIPKSRRPLSLVKEGEEVIIREVHGGRGVNRRLRELGIGSEMSVRVVQNSGGPVIISVGESRMALGKGVASKIMVE